MERRNAAVQKTPPAMISTCTLRRVSDAINMRPGCFPLLALFAFVGLTCVNWTLNDAGIAPSDSEALKCHGTHMTPVLDEALSKGENVLWCATFQMVWDSACTRFGRPIRLQPASKLEDSLNKTSFDKRGIDDESVFTAQGRVIDGVLEQIDVGVRKRTGSKPHLLDQLKATSAPTDLVFYAMLHKNLEFDKPFGKLGSWKLGERDVSWFGFSPEHKDAAPLRDQVLIHHYGAKNDFVIELLTKGKGDQLLLAKLPERPKSPAEISRHILKHLNASAPGASAKDLLAVPDVIANESARFSQLEGRTVVGKGEGLFLRNALQMIYFRMDEKGVKLHSEAAVSFGCSAVAHVEPRLMILDPPFALVMKRKKAAQPYFVAWFANADLLDAR